MNFGRITVIAPFKTDKAKLTFDKRQWELAKKTLGEGETLWDYPIDELDYLCDPANEHCGEEFLLVGGRLRELNGLTFQCEFCIKYANGEKHETDTFDSLAEAMKWCEDYTKKYTVGKCFIYVKGNEEDSEPIATYLTKKARF